MQKRALRLGSIACAWAALACAGPAAAARLQALPSADAERIYAPVALPGTPAAQALATAGYEQREYLLSGTANIYGYGPGGELVVERADVPYTTRILVVAPKDPRRFSGSVQLTNFHPSLGRAHWSRLDAYVLRSGDAYVVVGVGGDEQQRKASTPQAPTSAPLLLKWFDPARYAAFDWPEDDGVRWDVFSQAAGLLKQPDAGALLPGVRVEKVYASGWSFLGSFLRTFINEGFHDRLRTAAGKSVIDGYLIGISTPAQGGGYLQINSHTPALPPGHPRRALKPIDVPVIQMLSENEAVANTDPVRTGAAASAGLVRTYELAGASHTDVGFDPGPETAIRQLAARGHPAGAAPPPCALAPTDVPMRDVAQAALANLDRWSRTGVAAPPDARLQLTGPNAPARDSVGNSLGGVRVAQLDLPLARYGAPDDGSCGRNVFLVLRRIPLSPEEIRRLYPKGEAGYLARFQARLDALVTARWLLREDAAAEMVRARALADEAFARD